MRMFWNTRRRSLARHDTKDSRAGRAALSVVGLSLLLLLGIAACAPESAGSASSPVPAPTTTVDALSKIHNASPTPIHNASPTPATTVDALSKIHNASPDYIPLFARITFTDDTTYAQATAILKGHVYPWTCDDPRSPTPPSAADQQALFDTSHMVYISYPAWDELARIAASPQVIAADGAALYQCS